ncbi:MAG: hypothetical protein JWP11_3670 [Frankiales bacterium]|nr:hypothetical protein [Frankiales bacterium]
MAPTPAPTVGRIVHYQSYGTPNGEHRSKPRAAVVTEVAASAAYLADAGDGHPFVSLCVLNPEGMFFNRDVPYAETPTPGRWSWPPRA